ncbi:MAG: ATPase inhibitor subunit zeta, partial [Pseudomonadota bacterium]
AAGKMGITDGDAVEAYAKEVIMADFEEAGDEDVYRKVSGDLEAKGATWNEAELREQMVALMTEAKAQLMSEID